LATTIRSFLSGIATSLTNPGLQPLREPSEDSLVAAIPDIRYAKSGDVSIAYQVIGEGSPDLVFVRGLTGDLLSSWEQPLLVRHVVDLASNGRLLMLDKRGTGLSDPVAGMPTLEIRMDDIRAVMDAAGSDRAVLWTGLESTFVGALFAATYPERTLGLVLLNPQARGTAAADYPWAPTESEWRDRLADIRGNWGTRDHILRLLRARAPSMTEDPAFTEWFMKDVRRSLSPGAAAAYARSMIDADVTDVLPAVRVPTMIMYSPASRAATDYVQRRIPNATAHELSRMIGDFTWIDDETHELTQALVRDFVASLEGTSEPERILATVLFTDIVGSTERQASLGDRAWKELVERHHAIVRAALGRSRGTENDTAGDGFYATFDGPARAIRCALEIAQNVRDLGIEIRAGIHTGECEVVDGKCSGLTVSIGARVTAKAGPSEVLVSQTVKDLVAGSGLTFEDAGEHDLKGVPDRWRLYRVVA
jgi:class 3 adenylate cyclase